MYFLRLVASFFLNFYEEDLVCGMPKSNLLSMPGVSVSMRECCRTCRWWDGSVFQEDDKSAKCHGLPIYPQQAGKLVQFPNSMPNDRCVVYEEREDLTAEDEDSLLELMDQVLDEEE